MRGYSIFEDVFPIIVVNRKDAEAARIFTLIHELTHLYLRASGLCDLEARTDIPPEEQRLEQFCNDVAANVLVPVHHFTEHHVMTSNTTNVWTEDEISTLARDYCVSREMIARRLVEIGRADKVLYRDKRDQYLEEYKDVKAKSCKFLLTTHCYKPQSSRFVLVDFASGWQKYRCGHGTSL
nr:ImmA/IrrE family metallo-endopeptidase [Teredinibacter turnerae]